MDYGAGQAFVRVVKGKNFMTPHVVEYGFIGNSTIPYEISRGEGFDYKPIFGFSVGLPISDHRRREWSGLFHSLDEVRLHIEELRRIT